MYNILKCLFKEYTYNSTNTSDSIADFYHVIEKNPDVLFIHMCQFLHMWNRASLCFTGERWRHSTVCPVRHSRHPITKTRMVKKSDNIFQCPYINHSTLRSVGTIVTRTLNFRKPFKNFIAIVGKLNFIMLLHPNRT